MSARTRGLRLVSFTMVLLVLGLAATSSADTIYVPDDYPTIQEAIDAAGDGDEIIVAEGTYVEHIDFLGKDIIVRSTDPTDAEVVAGTIIDGSQSGTVVTMTAGTISGFTIQRGYGDSVWYYYESAGGVYATETAAVTYNVILDNFAERFGGGIYATDDVIVASNRIIGNESGSRGGGAYLFGRIVFTDNTVTGNRSTDEDSGGVNAAGEVLVSGCLIDNNHANSSRDGGGVSLSDDCILEDCTISNNTAFQGSGIQAYGRCVIRRNTITGNAGSGYSAVRFGDSLNDNEVFFFENHVIYNQATGIEAGGHAVVHSNVVKGNVGSAGAEAGDDVVFANNTVVSNSGSSVGGVSCGGDAIVVNNIIAFALSGGGIEKRMSENGLADYNCVYGNVGGDYSDDYGADPTPGPHDINEDPLLTYGGYHLTPSSPCIGAGWNGVDFVVLSGSDIDGERRLQSCNVDIGADEFTDGFTAVLSVRSSLPNGLIAVSPADCNGASDGVGSFNRAYANSELVTLAVEDTDGFVRWIVNGMDQPEGDPSVIVEMKTDTVASAVYSVIHVPDDSLTIQGAIDAASDGTLIIVAEGTYVEDIDFVGKSLFLRSTDPTDWDVVAATIIDGSTPGLGTVTLTAGEIAGFTIRDGNRGVQAEGDAVVRRCIITNNQASHAAGVRARGSALIASNIITFNGSSGNGAGIQITSDAAAVSNLIAFNTSETRGGGVYMANGFIVGNTIIANAALDSGGGIRARDLPQETPVIRNNIVAFSTFGGGIDAGLNANSDYNCVFGNVGGDYVGELGPGPNDINVDPLLDVDGVHLLADSPCIDAGDPDFVPGPDERDIDGQMRVWDGDEDGVWRVDMGSDEFGSIIPGDFNGDGCVDQADLGILLSAWGIDDGGDLNGDGDTDHADLGILLAHWGEGCP